MHCYLIFRKYHRNFLVCASQSKPRQSLKMFASVPLLVLVPPGVSMCHRIPDRYSSNCVGQKSAVERGQAWEAEVLDSMLNPVTYQQCEHEQLAY